MEKTKDVAIVVEEKVKGMQAMIANSPVTNDEECGAVSDKIKSVKNLLAYIKQEKDKLVAPAKAIITEAGLKYDPFIKECQNAEIVLKQRAQKYLDDKDAKEAADKKKILDKVETGYIKPETAVKKLEELPEQKATIRTTDSGLRRTQKATPVIVDVKLIPDEFWEVNEVAVRKEALERHKAGTEQIPGVRIDMVSVIASV